MLVFYPLGLRMDQYGYWVNLQRQAQARPRPQLRSFQSPSQRQLKSLFFNVIESTFDV